MPSQTGSLTNRLLEDGQIVNLALSLGLLRPGNFSLTPLGGVLRQLMPPSEVSAFKEYRAEENPYFLTLAQKVFFLFCLISSDGDVVKRLYAKLRQVTQEFSRATAGDMLARVFREMGLEFKGSAVAAGDVSALRKWQEYARMIEQQPRTSHSGVREQRVTLRLEAFVDLGWLVKDDPSKYAYRFSPAGLCFSEKLMCAIDVGAFLQSSFFEAATECFGCGAARAEASDEILESVVPAYLLLRSDLGYSPLFEMLLLANLRALEEGRGRFFELRSGVEAVRAWQRQYPDDVRFSVDSRGDIRYVRFGEALTGGR
jgi:hypothetical protein